MEQHKEQSRAAEGFDGPLHCVSGRRRSRTLVVPQIQLVVKTDEIPQRRIVDDTVMRYVDQETDTSEKAPVNARFPNQKMVLSDQAVQSRPFGLGGGRCWEGDMGSQHLDRAEAFMRVFAHRGADPLSVRRLANNTVPYSLCSVRLSGKSGRTRAVHFANYSHFTVQRAPYTKHSTH